MAHNRHVGLGALPLAITLVVAPAQLKMDAGATPATVTVTAAGATRLRLWCSLGEVSRVQKLGDGVFRASFTPPASGKPTYAVLAAWDEESGEAATATVPLLARTEIPVETEAGAQVAAVVHGRRSTAHANRSGQARVPAWVWPGDTTAMVTATDSAGNATTNEVALELPPPDGVFLLAPSEVAAGQPVRVWAFATGGVTPQLSASGATLSSATPKPGATSALLRTWGPVTLTATAGGDRVQQRIRVAAVTPPPERSVALGEPPPLPDWAKAHPSTNGSSAPPNPSPAAPPSPAPSVSAAPLPPLSSWELGAALAGGYSGPFLGGGGTLELRRRLRRFAFGLDVAGRYAHGALSGDDVAAGGLGLRAVGEARFGVARRVALFVGAGAGGHWARVRRAPPFGAAVSSNDGGPSLSAAGGALVRVGPGYVELAVGYAWTPLVANALGNLDGATVTVGYRAARWRRRWRARAGGTRPRRRRRRARDR
jgi:hypothetical protein